MEVNIIKKIKKAVKHPGLALSTLRDKLFFNFRYGSNEEYVMKFKSLTVRYLTTDKHSKHWFFPRYDKGKIHEPIVTKMLVSSLNASDVFVDVGTYVGYFTCIAGKVCTKGKVYGFEVDMHAFGILEKNIKYNNLSNIEVFNYGVSNKKGFVKIPKTLFPNPGLSVINDKNNKNYLSVKAVSLDDFFKNKKDKPNIVKIDVEGAELLVLKGMQSLLEEESITLFLELHGNKLDEFNTNSKEVISFLNKLGYEVNEILNHRSNNVNEERRLKKLEDHYSIKYNTMCYITKTRRY